MTTRRATWGIALLCAVALLSLPAPALSAGEKAEVPHTITWWCADLNDVWNVKVPVIGPSVWLVPPVPPPIPDPCVFTYPVPVPEGWTFAPGFLLWFTNKTYPPAVRARLEEMGYNFHSQSPAEDFMSKLEQIRVEVRTYPQNVLVAEHRFDPQKYFRLIRVRELYGSALESFWGPFPWVDSDLGIDLSAEEVGRLPMVGFPVIVPPPGPPGGYRIWAYFTMSDWHNDGTCLDDCILPAGEFLYVTQRLTVVP